MGAQPPQPQSDSTQPEQASAGADLIARAKAEEEATTAAMIQRANALASSSVNLAPGAPPSTSPPQPQPVPPPVPEAPPEPAPQTNFPQHVAPPPRLNEASLRISAEARNRSHRLRRKNSWALAAFSIAVLVIFILLIIGMYLFFYMPRIVLADYFRKIAEVQTGTMTGQLEIKDTSGTKLNLQPSDLDLAQKSRLITSYLSKSSYKLDLKYNIKDPRNPQVATNFTIDTQGVATKVESIIDEKALFLHIDKNPLFDAAGIKVPQDWFKIGLPDSIFSKATCTIEDQEHSILSRNVLRFMPVKNIKRVGITETISGHRVVHTRGEVNMSTLINALNLANENLPPECQITLKEEQLAGVTAYYNLYTSKNFDRISLEIIDTRQSRHTDITLDSENYAQDVGVYRPEQFRSIRSIGDVISVK